MLSNLGIARGKLRNLTEQQVLEIQKQLPIKQREKISKQVNKWFQER